MLEGDITMMFNPNANTPGDVQQPRPITGTKAPLRPAPGMGIAPRPMPNPMMQRPMPIQVGPQPMPMPAGGPNPMLPQGGLPLRGIQATVDPRMMQNLQMQQQNAGISPFGGALLQRNPAMQRY